MITKFKIHNETTLHLIKEKRYKTRDKSTPFNLLQGGM